MLIDTHCHLYVDEFNEDRDEMIGRALSAGVSRFYLPAIDSGTHAAMLLLEEKYPGTCFAMAGVHPCSIKAGYETEIALVREMLAMRKFAGIGETGLDLYWDKTFFNEQVQALELQAELALEYELPIVLHTRNATQETIEVISRFAARGLKGVFHCFGGTLSEAQQMVHLGYTGIGGVVTYKKSGLDEVLREIDLKHVVLETDAPYLSPVPYRGKRNESSYLIHVAEKISLIKNIPSAEVERVTTENALIYLRQKFDRVPPGNCKFP